METRAITAKLKLLRLHVKNFKGVSNFTLDIDGDSASVLGKNGAGKTTLADAYYWLFCNCDSEGKGKFSILSLDESGNEVGNKNAEVAADMLINGTNVELKKVYKQNWVKVRGKGESEFSGHSTCYYIDNLKVKKKEYDDYIAGIIPPKDFRIISDIGYFVENTKIDYRRSKLMDLAGDVSDEFIITSDSRFADIPEITKGKSPDIARKIISGRMKELNKQIDDIPKLIAENKGQMPDTGGVLREEIVAQQVKIERKIGLKRIALSDLDSGFSSGAKRSELIELGEEVVNIRREMATERQAAMEGLNRESNRIKAGTDKLMHEKFQLNKEAVGIVGQMDRIDDKKERLKIRYYAAHKAVFSHGDKCGHCGQIIPSELINSKKAEFEKKNQIEKDTINKEGKALSDQLNSLQAKLDDVNKLIDENSQALDIAAEAIKNLTEKTDQINMQIDKKYAALIDANRLKRAAIEKTIQEISENSLPEKQKIEQEISDLKAEMADLNKKLNIFDKIEDKQQRIDELNLELKTAASEYERLQGQIFTLELFEREKAKMIEQSVSDHFEITQWKLFDQQINGGMRDVCEPMRDGVPYSTDLNHGSKINVGLDISNVLAAKMGVSMPVWIDGAESLTSLIDTGHQVINLVVSKEHEALTVL